MGSKCFRPINQNRQPVYVTTIQHAFDAAHLVYALKNPQKPNIIQDITKNQQRKGNLKKLFDHLNSHEKNFISSIQECNRKTNLDRTFPAVVVSDMFCQQLVKMLSDKKGKFAIMGSQKNIAQTGSKFKNNLVSNQLDLRNMIHQIEPHFFNLVTKILVYNKQRTIKNSISKTLIQYSEIFEGKITSKKQLKIILDLYLTLVFQKNINLIDKNSFLPYYAYSSLISKSKSELFTAHFIDQHFNFILKLFFELEDTKLSNRTLVESDDFNLFQHSVQTIIKEFIIFSSSNKPIKNYILQQIMLEEDAQKFDPLKTSKLQRFVYENLDTYTRQHFMFDWLGYLIRYIGRKLDNGNQTFKDSFLESLQELHLPISSNSIKNNISIEAKVNSMETLKRWFIEELLNTEKTLQYFSYRIFEALLLNLYNPLEDQQQVISKSKDVLNYFLQKKPKKLSQIFIILNKQLRSHKNLYFFTQHHNVTRSLNGARQTLVIAEEQAVERLWKNDFNFIVQEISIKDSQFKLSIEEIEQFYAPLMKTHRPSINLVYLIELSGICLKYSNLKENQIQFWVYNFLISLTESLKVPDQEIDFEFAQKFTKKSKFLLYKLSSQNEAILYSFLKYNFKNLLKEHKSDQLWTLILILVILINIVMEQGKNKDSDRYKKLNKFLEQVLNSRGTEKSSTQRVYEIYRDNKGLFDLSQRMSAHFQKIKLNALEHFKLNSEALPKSLSNIENSVLSSRLQVSDSNPDSDFRNICQMIFKK